MRADGTEVAHEFDDVKIWLDRDADGILDAGDDVQVADTFNSGALTLSYDDNGNLTDDGILAYVYDAWNRLVQAQRSADGDTTTVATYVYDGKNRRVSKTVTNNGVNNGGQAPIYRIPPPGLSPPSAPGPPPTSAAPYQSQHTRSPRPPRPRDPLPATSRFPRS